MPLRGTATDARGRPIPDLDVEASWAALPEPVMGRTDDAGNFELDVDAGLQDEIVLRARLGDELVAVQDYRPTGRLRVGVTLVVDEPYASKYRLFGRAVMGVTPIDRAVVTVVDLSGAHQPQQVTTARTGRFSVVYDHREEPPFVRLVTVASGRTMVNEQPINWTSPSLELDVPLVEAPTYSVVGHVVERPTGSGAAGVVVELRDRSGRWPNPVATSKDTTESGRFDLAFSAIYDPPAPTFFVSRRGVVIASVDWEPAWPGDGVLHDVTIAVEPLADHPAVYHVAGQAFDRVTRRGVSGLRIEAWDRDLTRLLRATDTDRDGAFSLAIASITPGEPPTIALRVYQGSKLIAQTAPLELAWSPAGDAATFLEVDPAQLEPRTFAVSGRVVDSVSRAGVFGVRVEAWDRLPRPGGMAGFAVDTANDGAFTVSIDRIPGGGVASVAPPDLFFRLYASDQLLGTQNPGLSWTPAGTAVTVLEVAAPIERESTEVGLHELGENLATTVDRVQQELARYPTSMGAYLLDEIDLEIPVDMRVDQLGQVRTKVLDSGVSADRNIGRVRMRVKPVLGVAQRPADVRDQPLATLADLSDEAIGALARARIYSVEDLVRTAQTAAGRTALGSLDLGVDLDVLLGKAALLALPTLPRPVREALVKLGYPNPAAFVAETDGAGLAAKLTIELDQAIGDADVTAWQARTRRLLTLPLPSDEENGP